MSRVEDYLAKQVTQRPDALALSDSTGLRWSYRALDAAAAALADEFAALGVKKGDRVMVVSENCASAVAALFAAWQMGAIAVPVNARQTEPEIDRVLQHATPRLVLFTSDVSTDARAHADRMGADTIIGLWGSLGMAKPCQSDPYPDPDIAILLYTTGTTGDPKGVMLTHGNVRFGGLTSANLRAMTPVDMIYGVLPTTHVFGLCSVVVAGIYAGAPVRLVPRFDVKAVYDGLRDGITLFSAVPQMHALLMTHARTDGLTELDSETLRYVSSGAAPLDPTWKREAEAFYGVALQNGYGMTETTAGTSATRNVIGDPDTSVGPPLPGIEVAIDASAPGGDAGMGEVMTRGPHIMRGYFRNPEETEKVLDAQGWMHTGDLGCLDAKGHLHILGRSKELIIHGGFNVYPPEVEAALNDHPGVVQAAVVGRQIEGNEEVLAFVQVAADSTLTEVALKDFVADRLAGYKRPARIILATALPAAPTGKILKHKLFEAFAQALA
ncbi:class I adenylate-forming enzyme family protein [Tateyamaria pelophila]|uniref:class I adenylate-forming enzyme family protein n=1 Tax=Tateyamaria pelophila TaxID=328415 RepID=UPI001CBCB1B4|nr:class I adenylate-forming enzyme family protein [Tateyamaria pelophila]